MFRSRLWVLFATLSAIGCSDEPAARVDPACAPFALPDRGDVRAFVVGHKQTLADAVSYESYEHSFRRHVEAIEPCLSSERPNLIVFPENAALGALLIGSRGEEARSQPQSTAAFGSMLGTYSRPFDWYQEQYPNGTFLRWLLLALTDTTWRAFERTFAGIARDYSVWVISSADVAPAEQRTDPGLIAELGDPDLPDQAEVWVATSAAAYNSAYLFDPSGAISGRVDKVFLTDPEEQALGLDNGALTALSVLTTPFARIGVATSRDAFYPPFMQRLEDLDADLIVQPEAFSGWGLGELPLEWLPDVFTSSAWTHQQKYRTFRHNLTPQYTGNFFELYFDGQVHVTERARPGRGSGGYIGQDPIPGWTALGPWVTEEPGTGPIDARRNALRQVGLELLPGSGSPRENAYIDSMIAVDLELSSAAKPVPVERDSTKPESRAIDPSGAGTQRSADLVSHDGSAIVVWQDDRSSDARVHFALTSDGAVFEARGEVAPTLSGAQRRPAVCAASDGRVGVVFQHGKPEQVFAATAPGLGAPFEPPIAVGAGSGPEWEPDCGFLPSGELVVVWSDLSSGVARLFASTRGSGAAFSAPVAVDPSTAGRPRVEGTQIQPALSNDARALVWLDYRDRSWDVYAARWDGSAFSGAVRIDGAAPEQHERLCGEPRVEAAGELVVATWTDLRDRRAHPDIAFATSADGGLTWSGRQLVSGGPGSVPSRTRGGSSMPRYRPDVVLAGAGARLVFQDLAPDKSAIALAQVAAESAGGPARLDDTGEAPVSLTRPRAAQLAQATLIVWEDDRDGAARIYAARRD
jgi:hypothetical protein